MVGSQCCFHTLLSFSCVHVWYMHVCACAHLHGTGLTCARVQTCKWRTKVGAWNNTQPLLCLTHRDRVFKSNPELLFGEPSSSDCPGQATMSTQYLCWLQDLNSSPHTCSASILTTEPSLSAPPTRLPLHGSRHNFCRSGRSLNYCISFRATNPFLPNRTCAWKDAQDSE